MEVRACVIGFSFAGISPPGATSAEGGVVVPRGPTGRAISAEGGVTVHRGADHVELPRLARPKGCFDTSAEWS